MGDDLHLKYKEEPVKAVDHYPASPNQLRIWTSAQADPQSRKFNNVAVIRFRGSLNQQALFGAFDDLLNRHSTLNACMSYTIDDGLVVKPCMKTREFCSFVDYREIPSELQSVELDRIVAQLAQQDIDFEQDRPINASLIQFANDFNVLVLVVSQIASDGWSFAVLKRDLLALYAKRTGHFGVELSQLQGSYRQYARRENLWHKSSSSDRSLAWWRERLDQVQIASPFDTAGSKEVTGRGIERVSLQIDESLARDVTMLSSKLQVTPFALIYAASLVVISVVQNNLDVAIGTPILGRVSAEEQELVGSFVNLVILRCLVNEQETFVELARRAQKVVVESMDHGRLSFDRVAAVLADNYEQRKVAENFLIVADNTDRKTAQLGDLQISVDERAPIDTEAETTLMVSQREGEIALALDYQASRIDHGQAKRFLGRLRSVLSAAVKDCEQKVGQMDIRGPAESMLQAGFENCVAVADDLSDPIDIIEKISDHNPESVAIDDHGELITYGALTRRVEVIACALVKTHKVGPGTRVAIAFTRSSDAIVAMLAILKAGAAYVPIATHWPQERIIKNVEDAECALIICNSDHVEKYNRLSKTATIETLEAADLDGANFAEYSLDSLCYIIFTSGTTGRPKGVAVSKEAMMKRIAWKLKTWPLSQHDRILHSTQLTFDISIWEIFWALCGGAQLVLVTEDTVADPALFSDVLEKMKPTAMHLVPSVCEALLDAAKTERWSFLKQVYIAGERFSSELYQRLRRRMDGEIVNMYGTTESVFVAAYHICTQNNLRHNPPIGRAMDGSSLHVRLGNALPAPIGVLGEIKIGGEIVPTELINSDISEIETLPYMDTGDVGYFDASGDLHFARRQTTNIKIAGQRIDLSEIEAAAQDLQGVRSACAVACLMGQESQEVALFLKSDSPDCDPKYLRSSLKAKIPQYMMPAKIIMLDAMPINANGKIDRRKLVERATNEATPMPHTDGFDGEHKQPTPAAQVKPVRAPSLGGKRKRSILDWFHSEKWSVCDETSWGNPTPPNLVWIIGYKSDLIDAIKERFQAKGIDTVIIRPACMNHIKSEEEFILDSLDSDAIAKFVMQQNQKCKLPDTMLFTELLESAKATEMSKRPYGVTDRCELALQMSTSLLAAIDSLDGEYAIRIVTASRNIHALGGQRVEDPGAAANIALAQMINAECANLSAISVDFSMHRSHSEAEVNRKIAQALLYLSERKHVPMVIANRDGEKWLSRRFERRPSSEIAAGQHMLRRGGIYLITGGLGGVGLEIAKRLVSRYGAKLILVGRTKLPPEDEWDVVLQSPDTAPETIKCLRRLNLLNDYGGTVRTIVCDVANEAEFRMSVEQIENELGSINGVIHAAGTGIFRPMQFRNSEGYLEEFRSKISGALVLERVFADRDGLDFISYFSSTTSVISIGHTLDYTAANLILNRLADYYDRPGARRISISWGTWQNLGISRQPTDLGQVDAQQATIDHDSFDADEGFLAFEFALKSSRSSLYVYPKDLDLAVLESRNAEYTDPDAVSNNDVLAVGAGSIKRSVQQTRVDVEVLKAAGPGSASSTQPQDQQIVEVVSDQFLKLLPVREVHEDDDFFDIGGHSIQLMRLINSLSKHFRITLPLAAIIREPTPKNIAYSIEKFLKT